MGRGLLARNQTLLMSLSAARRVSMLAAVDREGRTLNPLDQPFPGAIRSSLDSRKEPPATHAADFGCCDSVNCSSPFRQPIPLRSTGGVGQELHIPIIHRQFFGLKTGMCASGKVMRILSEATAGGFARRWRWMN
jgi:hypothetical protein